MGKKKQNTVSLRAFNTLFNPTVNAIMQLMRTLLIFVLFQDKARHWTDFSAEGTACLIAKVTVIKTSAAADQVSKGRSLFELTCLVTYISLAFANEPSPKRPSYQNECIPDCSQLSPFTDPG